MKNPSKQDFKNAFERLQKKYIEAVNRMAAAERAYLLSQMLPPFDEFKRCDKFTMNDDAAALMKASGRVHPPTWKNARYTVEVEQHDSGAACLSIKRNDKDAVGKERFRDFQRIKNELLGAEYEAIEIYPAESRLVDTSNQYWLWCLPEGESFPMGFEERMIVKGHNVAGAPVGESRQLPFDEPPPDAISIEQAEELARQRTAELEAES